MLAILFPSPYILSIRKNSMSSYNFELLQALTSITEAFWVVESVSPLVTYAPSESLDRYINRTIAEQRSDASSSTRTLSA